MGERDREVFLVLCNIADQDRQSSSDAPVDGSYSRLTGRPRWRSLMATRRMVQADQGAGKALGQGQSVATALAPGTVRVRWLVVETEETPHLTRWRSMLGCEELARADRYHFAADRHSYAAAHALVRFMLSEATGLSTRTWRYVAGEFGKPALDAEFSEWNLHFNISHTRGMVACAIARQEIGVDVERSDRTIDLEIARRYFAPEEIRILNSASPHRQVNTFFRFWVLKEAFIKATGEGLNRPLDSFSFALEPVGIVFHPERNDRPGRDNPAEWRFWEWQPANNCVAALAVWSAQANSIRLDAGPARAAEIGPL
jgi:4'-phosphopantetheinyl transferase